MKKKKKVIQWTGYISKNDLYNYNWEWVMQTFETKKAYKRQFIDEPTKIRITIKEL